MSHITFPLTVMGTVTAELSSRDGWLVTDPRCRRRCPEGAERPQEAAVHAHRTAEDHLQRARVCGAWSGRGHRPAARFSQAEADEVHLPDRQGTAEKEKTRYG